jgi:hypothetical protein
MKHSQKRKSKRNTAYTYPGVNHMLSHNSTALNDEAVAHYHGHGNWFFKKKLNSRL